VFTQIAAMELVGQVEGLAEHLQAARTHEAKVRELVAGWEATKRGSTSSGVDPRETDAQLDRVLGTIYRFMAGAPAQMDLLDYKPKMDSLFDTDLPESIRMGQRLTTMTGCLILWHVFGIRFIHEHPSSAPAGVTRS